MDAPANQSGANGATFRARRARINAGFGRFYAPLAVIAFILTFFPYYQPKADAIEPYGNLWQEVARTGHPFDVAALLAFLVVVVLLVLAGLEHLGPVGLGCSAACGLIIGALLCGRPGFFERPPLSSAGIADAVLCFTVALVLILHAALLIGFTRTVESLRGPAADRHQRRSSHS